MNTLDIRDFKETNLTAITNAVKDTQRYIIHELPNQIIMTKKQYQVLQHDPDMLHNEKDHLYITPLNVMEVVVQ